LAHFLGLILTSKDLNQVGGDLPIARVSQTDCCPHPRERTRVGKPTHEVRNRFRIPSCTKSCQRVHAYAVILVGAGTDERKENIAGSGS